MAGDNPQVRAGIVSQYLTRRKYTDNKQRIKHNVLYLLPTLKELKPK